MSRSSRPALLCISQSFSPEATPTAIRASKLLEHLSEQWNITLLTETGRAQGSDVKVEILASRRPTRSIAALRRLKLEKLLGLFVWPDESIFWTVPAIIAGWRHIKRDRPSAIVVFMMPYSSGLAGVVLARLSGLPLVLNLDDSPTCTDMHPFFVTSFHYRAAKALEDLYARRADAVVYVSQTNLEAVRSRQPPEVQEKFHLVRYGADEPIPQPPSGAPAMTDFDIAYVGAMSGWWALIGPGAAGSRARRLYERWMRLGRHQLTVLDQRTSSPAVIGNAISDALAEHPDWAGRVRLTIHGNPYAASVVERALNSAGVQDTVTVLDPVPHDQIAAILARADLLFLTLPRRTDGSRGGRISAKTYEYLMTDKPILAAVPQGENWDYLSDKPGVWLVEPDDRRRMRKIVSELAAAKFAGRALAFDRTHLHKALSYEARAAELAIVIEAAIEHHRQAGSRVSRRAPHADMRPRSPM